MDGREENQEGTPMETEAFPTTTEESCEPPDEEIAAPASSEEDNGMAEEEQFHQGNPETGTEDDNDDDPSPDTTSHNHDANDDNNMTDTQPVRRKEPEDDDDDIIDDPDNKQRRIPSALVAEATDMAKVAGIMMMDDKVEAGFNSSIPEAVADDQTLSVEDGVNDDHGDNEKTTSRGVTQNANVPKGHDDDDTKAAQTDEAAVSNVPEETDPNEETQNINTTTQASTVPPVETMAQVSNLLDTTTVKDPKVEASVAFPMPPGEQNQKQEEPVGKQGPKSSQETTQQSNKQKESLDVAIPDKSSEESKSAASAGDQPSETSPMNDSAVDNESDDIRESLHKRQDKTQQQPASTAMNSLQVSNKASLLSAYVAPGEDLNDLSKFYIKRSNSEKRHAKNSPTTTEQAALVENNEHRSVFPDKTSALVSEEPPRQRQKASQKTGYGSVGPPRPPKKRSKDTWTVGAKSDSNAHTELPASGMSLQEFLARHTLATANPGRGPSLVKQPQQATNNVDGEDEETRAVAAELESLRRARTASSNVRRQSRRTSLGSESNEAAKFLRSWADQGPPSRKRPYEASPGAAERSKRRFTPNDSSVADAAVMAQIGQMPLIDLTQREQPSIPRAPAPPPPTAATPPTPTYHDKAFLVEQATELVCRALLDGPWPCVTDFSVVVAALHQFASDIIVPALNAVDPETTVVSDTPIILGTLLMLREALILNADTIFGTANEQDDDILGRRSNQRNSQSDYFTACTLSTSVLLAALDSLDGESSSTFTSKFLRLVDAYESGQGDFAQLAMEVDDDDDDDDEPVTTMWPNGTPMEDQVQDAWRTSHRWHMDSHPSVLARRHGPDVRPMHHNAVHISVIGEQHVHEAPAYRH